MRINLYLICFYYEFRRSKRGQYLGLEPKISLKYNLTKTEAEFYTPMLTTQTQNACRMRFFYFIHGESATINQVQLKIFIRKANKIIKDENPLKTISISPQTNGEQRWNKIVIEYQSTEPFQFVFHGKLVQNISRVAIDDITYDSNCYPSNTKPLTTTTAKLKTTTTTTKTTTIHKVTTTGKPIVDNHPDKNLSPSKLFYLLHK